MFGLVDLGPPGFPEAVHGGWCDRVGSGSRTPNRGPDRKQYAGQ